MSCNLDYEKIGERIATLRKEFRVSQFQLAELIEVSDTYISYIETGKKRVSLEVLYKISEALSIPIDSLLLGNNDLNEKAYMPEIESLISDCSKYERAVLFDIAKATKNSLRNNKKIKK